MSDDPSQRQASAPAVRVLVVDPGEEKELTVAAVGGDFPILWCPRGDLNPHAP
jgi:hypothetical protein